MDDKTTFLHREMDEVIFMDQRETQSLLAQVAHL